MNGMSRGNHTEEELMAEYLDIEDIQKVAEGNSILTTKDSAATDAQALVGLSSSGRHESFTPKFEKPIVIISTSEGVSSKTTHVIPTSKTSTFVEPYIPSSTGQKKEHGTKEGEFMISFRDHSPGSSISLSHQSLRSCSFLVNLPLNINVFLSNYRSTIFRLSHHLLRD